MKLETMEMPITHVYVDMMSSSYYRLRVLAKIESAPYVSVHPV